MERVFMIFRELGAPMAIPDMYKYMTYIVICIYIRVGKNPGFLQKIQPTRVFWENPWVCLKKPGFNVFFFKFKWVFKKNVTKSEFT